MDKSQNKDNKYNDEELENDEVQTPEDLSRKCCLSLLEDLYHVHN